jgi:hypothetical protein
MEPRRVHLTKVSLGDKPLDIKAAPRELWRQATRSGDSCGNINWSERHAMEIPSSATYLTRVQDRVQVFDRLRRPGIAAETETSHPQEQQHIDSLARQTQG